METAFRATIETGEGPTVAILCEYDALPGIGHACGHNVIATSGAGAGAALAAVRASCPRTHPGDRKRRPRKAAARQGKLIKGGAVFKERGRRHDDHASTARCCTRTFRIVRRDPRVQGKASHAPADHGRV